MDLQNYSTSLLVLSILVFVHISLASDTHSDSSSLLTNEKTTRSMAPGGMWFGPRLGRRMKKSELGSYNNEQLNNLIEFIQENPWAILAMNEGKRQNWSPRSDRQSSEDRWLQDADLVPSSADQMSARSPPFAPRLGRVIGGPYGLYV